MKWERRRKRGRRQKEKKVDEDKEKNFLNIIFKKQPFHKKMRCSVTCFSLTNRKPSRGRLGEDGGSIALRNVGILPQRTANNVCRAGCRN
jgi:hypothetical protein